MGGNMSRVNQGRTQVANATAVPNYDNTKPSYNYSPWSAMHENRVTTPACAPKPSTNYNNLPEFKVHRPSEIVATTTTTTTTSTNRVIDFHSAARWREYFETAKYSNKLVIIYFTATWCGPCKYIEPAIKELAAKYNDIEIVKIDVDELFNVSREFGVQAMPTFMFIKRGKQIDKVVGANKDDLQKKIEKHRV